MPMFASYAQALQALYSRIDWEQQRRRTPEALRLTPVRRLLERLGNPQYRYATIHIAGTKGKGSTAAMLEAVLRAAGYRTGLYTSPHLHTLRERIRIQGRLLSPATFRDLLGEIWPLVTQDPELSVFDVLTGVAFLAFRQAGVEVAVVEVGLGGRLDSTNVIAPSLCLVTRLGLDHTEILGSSLAEVAYEKAGIFKPGVPVVVAPQEEEARRVLQGGAADRGAALYALHPQDFQVLHLAVEGQQVRLPSLEGRARVASMALLGRHQAENAALVALATDILRDRGWTLPETALHQGLPSTQWPGRFEVLDAARPLVVDGAHNPEAARALAHTLTLLFPNRSWRLLVGFSHGKDMAGFLRVLQATLRVQELWATRAAHPRAVPAEVVARIATRLGFRVYNAENVAQALHALLAAPGPLLVTGSLFVVAEAREAWAALGYMPMPEKDPAVLAREAAHEQSSRP